VLVCFHPSLSGDRPFAWPRSLEIAAEAGFTAMDFDLDRLGDNQPEAIRRRLDASGIAGCASPLPIELREDVHTFESGFERFRRLVATAAEIGIRTMHRSIPASTDREPREYVEVLRQRWARCAAVTREHDITLAVEPLGTLYRRRAGRYELFSRLGDVHDFARSCGPGVGLLLDSWHWHLAGSTAQEIVDSGERIAHVHVADVPDAPAETLRDTERALPGDGVVDFESFFAALDKAGYEGTVGPEVPGSWSHGLTPVDSARRGRAATLKVVGSR
jgi:sugar phosphate isomerase/epimerase